MVWIIGETCWLALPHPPDPLPTALPLALCTPATQIFLEFLKNSMLFLALGSLSGWSASLPRSPSAHSLPAKLPYVLPTFFDIPYTSRVFCCTFTHSVRTRHLLSMSQCWILGHYRQPNKWAGANNWLEEADGKKVNTQLQVVVSAVKEVNLVPRYQEGPDHWGWWSEKFLWGCEN